MLSTHCVIGKMFPNAYYRLTVYNGKYKIGKLSQVTLILPASDVQRREGKHVISKHLVVFGSLRRRFTHSCTTYYINGVVVDTEQK